MCTLGPILVLFHTAFKFGGIVSISFWSMVAVFLSGIIGRFIYIQIPRTIEGRELSLSEIKNSKTDTISVIKEEFNLGDAVVRARLHDLIGKGLIKVDKSHKPHLYKLNFKIFLPSPDSKIMESLKDLDLETKDIDRKLIITPKMSEDLLTEIFSKVYDNAEIIETQVIYAPKYEIVLNSHDKQRTLRISAFFRQ